MIEELLVDIGLASTGTTPSLSAILPAFGRWLSAQSISQDDILFVASRLGAYICLFLEDHHGATSAIVGDAIVVRLPMPHAIAREFDPYRMAYGLATAYATGERVDFAEVLLALPAEVPD